MPEIYHYLEEHAVWVEEYDGAPKGGFKGGIKIQVGVHNDAVRVVIIERMGSAEFLCKTEDPLNFIDLFKQWCKKHIHHARITRLKSR